jgi:hypothetical protein
MQQKVIFTESPAGRVPNDLIEACRKNDPQAQLKIYKLYYKTMYNASLSIVNDPFEAEDIMQESFLDAFERIGSFTGVESFEVWIKKIVYNRSVERNFGILPLRKSISKKFVPENVKKINLGSYQELLYR